MQKISIGGDTKVEDSVKREFVATKFDYKVPVQNSSALRRSRIHRAIEFAV